MNGVYVSSELNENIRNAVAAYSQSLFKVAFTYMKNTADAEDAVQEVFLAYLRRAPLFHDAAHEKAWLIRATINRCKDQLKSRWFSDTVPLTEDLAGMPQQDFTLLNAVLQLDRKYRLPVHLHYYEGYSISEIAQILHANPSTVGSWLARGRSILKDQIGGFGNER